MGQELTCRVDFGKQTSEGKALLETNELLFRGDFRLKIPYKDIRKISAADGELRILYSDGSAVFHLGPTAKKWADRILHPPSRLDKLGVKRGTKVALIGRFDSDFLDELRKQGAATVKKDAELTLIAVEQPADLESVIPDAAPLWVVYPKGVKTITESDVRSAGLGAGLVDVKTARFSATLTALKFTRRKTQIPRG